MGDISTEPINREVHLSHLAHKTADRYCATCNIQEQCRSYNPSFNATCTVDLDSDFAGGITVAKVQEAMLDLVASSIVEARMLLLQNKSLNINNPMAIKNIDTIMKMIERISKTSLFSAMATKVKEEEPPKPVVEKVVSPFEKLLTQRRT